MTMSRRQFVNGAAGAGTAGMAAAKLVLALSSAPIRVGQLRANYLEQ